ncbi:MAG: NAD-dependent epimerase/dehydratase family protein [Nitrososphaeria archaeon]
MSVLITGGCGLVGSHVAHELVEEYKSDKVILFDVSYPKNPLVLKHLGNKISFVYGNILDYGKLLEAIREFDVEGIIHTVAFVDYKFVVSNPLLSILTNVNGTLNVLELARVNDLKVVFTSSGAVYGQIEGSAREDMPIKPTDLYGMTKAAGEMMGEQYANTYGIDFITTRLYFLYGHGLSQTVSSVEEAFKPPVHPISVLYLFITKALKNEKLKIEKGGDSELDYTYIKDAAHGVVLAYLTKNPPHKIYNISSGRSYTLKYLAKIVNDYVGYEAIDIGSGQVEGWPKRAKYLDISLANKELGYYPRYGLENGVREYMTILKNEIKLQ